MNYPSLGQMDARRILEDRRAGRPVDVDGLVVRSGSGEPIDPRVERAARELESLRSRFPADVRESAGAGNRFDAEACAILHGELGEIGDRIAGDRGFWTWLAVARLGALIEWRAAPARGDPGKAVNPENYGIGDRWRDLPARLWFRAELAYNEVDGDRYALARRGSADFWESGVLRHRYSSCRALVKALARHQYPEEGEFRGDEYRPATLGLNGLRELYKRLRLYHASTSFEALDDGACSKLVKQLARGLR